jgi:arsenite-transporting ATPase
VRPGRVAAELVETSRSIRELQALLRDRQSTRFLVVTRAASVPRAETERLLGRLRRSNLSVGALIVNARTLSPGACPRCEAAAEGERRELARLGHAAARIGGCAIIQAPFVAPPPRGVRGLEEWAGHWTA